MTSRSRLPPRGCNTGLQGLGLQRERCDLHEDARRLRERRVAAEIIKAR
jgi:hypothetical protein